MNRETLYEAMTDIQEEYVVEADPESGSGFMPKVRKLRPVLRMVAVFAVVIGVAAIAIDSSFFKKMADNLETYVSPAAESPAAMLERGVGEACYDVGDAPAEAEEATAVQTEETAAAEESTYDFSEKQEDRAGEEATITDSQDEPSAKQEDDELPESAPEAKPENGKESPATDGTTSEGKTDITDDEKYEFEGVVDETLPELIPDVSVLPAQIMWNEAACIRNSDLYETMPAGAIYAGTLEMGSGAVFRTDSQLIEHAPVYTSGNTIYIPYGAYYVMYVMQ